MKRLLASLLVILGISFNVNADDIRDFEIEGISIGDSLLEHYDESVIKKHSQARFKNKTFLTLVVNKVEGLKGHNFETYDRLNIDFKNNDKNYEIYSISGISLSNYNDNTEACFKKVDKVFDELKELFGNQKIYPPKIVKFRADKSGKSKIKEAAFIFNQSADLIVVACYDYDKNMGYENFLKVSLDRKEFNDWMNLN